MSSDTEFTDENKGLMTDFDLLNVTLTLLKEVPLGPYEIKWKQFLMQAFGDVKREYWVAPYAIMEPSRNMVYQVFFPKEKFGRDELPKTLNTSGFSKNDCKLHFGFNESSTNEKALFFVVHPNNWGPFQKRFRDAMHKADTEFALLVEVASVAASAGAGVVTTAMATYYGYIAVGTVATGGVAFVVGAVATAGGLIAHDMVDRLAGDYLRYIG